MQFSILTLPHWALRCMVAFVCADRASTLPSRVINLEVNIAGVHGVGVLRSRRPATDRARDRPQAVRSAVVGAFGGAVIVKAALEAPLRSASLAPAWCKGQSDSIAVLSAR